jgi:SET domain-containing protein
MITVRISVGPSQIHGLGCIAEEEIRTGQLVWKFQPGFDLALKKEFIDSLPAGARENVLNYAYISKTTGDYILCSDDSKFTNHSPMPNVKCVIPEGGAPNELVCHATRTILPGEEITNDYRDFDSSPDDVVEGG